jgi:predicted transcriptional regulator
MANLDALIKFRAPKDIVERLERIAKIHRQPIANFERLIIADFVAFEEQRLGIAPQALQDNPAVRLSSTEAVSRALGGAGTALALVDQESAPKPAVAAPSGRKRGPKPISYQDPAPPPAAPGPAPK